MKKRCLSLLLLAALLTLASCGHQDKHPEWPEEWTRAGDHFAVETPEGYYLLEYNPTFAANGIWYMTWAIGQPGEEHLVLKEDGEAESTYYDAEVYLITSEYKTENDAEANIADWIGREANNYEMGGELALSSGGQSFRVFPLLTAKPDNPYSHGAAAFAVRGNLAFSVEVLCVEDFDGDPQEILELFLNGIHYGE